MINLAVINLKSVLKKLIKIIIVAFIVAMIFKFVKILCSENYMRKFFSNFKSSHVEIIESSMSVSSYLNNNKAPKESNLKTMLVSELAVFSAKEEELMEKENQEENIEYEDAALMDNQENANNESQSLEEIHVPVQDVPLIAETNVIQENNKVDKFTNNYGSVKIKNESSYELTTEMITPNVDFTNKKDIVIYHTHTCESYTPTQGNHYAATGTYRTTDLNYSVARVGTDLRNILSAKGYNVIHNTDYHDYPAYTGSYTRALGTINNILSSNKSVEAVLDIHRDALGSNSSYAPSVKIGDEVVAQLMFVIGTNGGGLNHPNWNNNLKLAIKIQEKANEMYPGLFKPIILRDSRYNQHVAKGACIIEVGATGNTLEQTTASMKYLANVISEVMK